MVDGWVAWDDRKSPDLISNDLHLRFRLLEAAHEAGADWVLRVDPDERFEHGLVDAMDKLTRRKRPVVWMFNLREMYAETMFRVDGLWGRKRQGRLFPIYDNLFPAAESGCFQDLAYHSASYPRHYRPRNSGFDLYHLKMIDPRRRRQRRDLYAALDPELKFQSVGYDYLSDESGARFRRIGKGREYFPPHREDGGLWMPETLPSAGGWGS